MKELCRLFDLSALLKRNVGKLSGGQRRRVDVARALLHSPKILILDEPTTGLDPQTRKMVWEVVDKLRKTDGITVFLTTHYMEEAAEADYVVILDSGEVVADGTPLDLKNEYTGDFVTLYGDKSDILKELGIAYEERSGAMRIAVGNTGDAAKMIIEHPELFEDFEITKGKMDDVFLAATGKKLTGGEEK